MALAAREGCLVRVSGQDAGSLDRTTQQHGPTVSDTAYVPGKVVVTATYSHAFRQDETPVQMPQLLPNSLLLLRTMTQCASPAPGETPVCITDFLFNATLDEKYAVSDP